MCVKLILIVKKFIIMLANYNPGNKTSASSLKSLDDTTSIELVSHLGQYDKRLLQWMVKFYNSINKDVIDMEEVQLMVNMLKQIKGKQTDNYLTDLLYPEFAENAKIPVDFPIPTSSFQLHQNFGITTNTLGNFALIMNPFYLEAAAIPASTATFLNVDVSLTGIASSNFFAGLNAGTTIPLTIYQRYRVVSASIQIRYIGRLDASSGILGGAITFEDIPNGTIGVAPGALARYGNFSFIEQSYYNTRANSLDGLRLLYVPVDQSAALFQNVGTYRAGANFCMYGQSFPPSSACLRCDYFINIEATADPQFQKYVPSDMGQMSSSDLNKQKIDYVVANSKLGGTVTDFDNNAKTDKKKIMDEGAPPTPSFLDQMSDTVMGVVKSTLVPSIGDIAKYMLSAIF